SVGTNEKGKNKSKDAAPPSSETVVTKDDAKKDKEAKKEARKAAKAEAKSKEEKKTTETGQSLTACLPQTFFDFGNQKLGEVTLTFTMDDQPWVEALSRLSAKRNVAFKGAVSNDCKDPSTCVTASLGGIVLL
ncbi:hypothetical protein TELCIR_24767, partial [Teladorsagia circumcincta]